MSTNTLIKISRDISELRKDVATIRAVIFDADLEGEYKDSFVKKMLERMKEKALYVYRDKQSFLRHVRREI